MRFLPLVLPLVLILAAAGAASAVDLELPATRDARFESDPGEAKGNGGGNTRLRAITIAKPNMCLFVIDFDHAGVVSFVKKHGQGSTAKLVVYGRGMSEGAKANVQLATLLTQSEWKEGAKDGAPADKGECSFLFAQTDTVPWTNAKGAKVPDLREVFWNGSKASSVTNSKPLVAEANDTDRQLSVDLDLNFLGHFATDETCKGMVFFISEANVAADFYSREQNGKEPKLVLSAAR